MTNLQRSIAPAGGQLLRWVRKIRSHSQIGTTGCRCGVRLGAGSQLGSLGVCQHAYFFSRLQTAVIPI